MTTRRREAKGTVEEEAAEEHKEEEFDVKGYGEVKPESEEYEKEQSGYDWTNKRVEKAALIARYTTATKINQCPQKERKSSTSRLGHPLYMEAICESCWAEGYTKHNK